MHYNPNYYVIVFIIKYYRKPMAQNLNQDKTLPLNKVFSHSCSIYMSVSAFTVISKTNMTASNYLKIFDTAKQNSSSLYLLNMNSFFLLYFHSSRLSRSNTGNRAILSPSFPCQYKSTKKKACVV